MNAALRQALRDEMLDVLKGELDINTCSTMMRLAEAARDLLQARGSKPEDFKDGTAHVGDAPVSGLNVETYGVKMLRELLPVLSGALKPKVAEPTRSVEDLVRGLAEARRLGLDDVAEQLEDQIDCLTPVVPRGMSIPVSGDGNAEVTP